MHILIVYRSTDSAAERRVEFTRQVSLSRTCSHHVTPTSHSPQWRTFDVSLHHFCLSLHPCTTRPTRTRTINDTTAWRLQ